MSKPFGSTRELSQTNLALYVKSGFHFFSGGTRRRSLRSTSPPNVSEIIQPSMPIIPHGPSTTNQPITQEIHQKTMESHHEKLRSELFGLNDGNLRKRNLQDVPNDLDDSMKDHQESQEQVAEEMLSLTKTLKEQVLKIPKKSVKFVLIQINWYLNTFQFDEILLI